MFTLYYPGYAAPKLEGLVLLAASRYDLVFRCADDIAYDDTLDRSGDVWRHIFQNQNRIRLALS